ELEELKKMDEGGRRGDWIRHEPCPARGELTRGESVMATVTKDKLLSFEDFCVLVNDGKKADLLDGVIHMASPDNTDANELNAWLLALMLLFAQRKKLGKVYMSRVAFRLDDCNAPEPDIGFVRKARLKTVRRGQVDGPPDLAVEIVSPDSVDR